jgi:hypothetical protein
MDSKYIKYQSVQGGPFTASQNLIDFRLPSSGLYDLADSYINLLCSVEATQSAAQDAAGQGVWNLNGAWNSPDAERVHFQNVALVKNASMNTQLQGRIENLRRVDILRDNLATYTKTQMEDLNESYLDAANFENPVNSQAYGIFTQINKTGLDKSRYNRQTPISIRLSDVFEFCRVREYDSDRTGETHIHLELNRDKFTVVPIGLSEGSQGRTFPTEVLQGNASEVAGTTGNNIIVVGDNGATAPARGNPYVFTDLAQSPYYVGQMLTVSATGTNGAPSPADAPAVISQIEWDKTGTSPNNPTNTKGAIILHFEQPWGAALAATQQYTDIAMKVDEPAAVSVSLDAAELVMRHKASKDGIDKVTYHTYSTEETNGNGLTSFQNLYTVEPEANNVLIMFPDGADGLVSKNADIASWRLRLNNEDLTDRPVVRKSPLAYDRLAMTLNSMGAGLGNLVQNCGKTNAQTWPGTYTDTKFDSVIVANPLFQTTQQKLLQVNIEAGGGGVQKLVLFKQLPRVFEY